MQKITVFIWQGNSKAPKNDKPFTLEASKTVTLNEVNGSIIECSGAP